MYLSESGLSTCTACCRSTAAFEHPVYRSFHCFCFEGHWSIALSYFALSSVVLPHVRWSNSRFASFSHSDNDYETIPQLGRWLTKYWLKALRRMRFNNWYLELQLCPADAKSHLVDHVGTIASWGWKLLCIFNLEFYQGCLVTMNLRFRKISFHLLESRFHRAFRYGSTNIMTKTFQESHVFRIHQTVQRTKSNDNLRLTGNSIESSKAGTKRITRRVVFSESFLPTCVPKWQQQPGRIPCGSQ